MASAGCVATSSKICMELLMTVARTPRSSRTRARWWDVVEESRNSDSFSRTRSAAASASAAFASLALLEARSERVFVSRDCRQHGTAVGAACETSALEFAEVAARGHRRDAEALLDLDDGYRAAGSEDLDDRRPSSVRGESNPFVPGRFCLIVSPNERGRSDHTHVFVSRRTCDRLGPRPGPHRNRLRIPCKRAWTESADAFRGRPREAPRRLARRPHRRLHGRCGQPWPSFVSA